MKKILFLLSMLLSLTLLFSCAGNDPGTTPPDDEKPEETPPTVLLFSAIVNADEDGAVGVSAISDAYYAAKGKMITIKNVSTVAEGTEIIVGETVSRPASVAATAALQSEMDASSASDAEGYIIYAKDGSVAIYWSNDYFAEMAVQSFIDKVINSGITELADGEVDKLCTSFSAYRENEKWGALEAVADADVVKAIKGLYSFILGQNSSAVYTWMANLYDPETGAFYYADSARDYVGFGPDLESTAQILQFLSGTGMFANGFNKDLPKDILNKLGDWVVSLQESDGYFYHPQWGHTAGQTRLGRDLSWATQLLDALGIIPKYKLASSASASLTGHVRLDTAVAVSAVIAVAEAEYLSNESLFTSYLESKREDLLSGKITSHSLGHELNAVKDIIFARGYGDAFFNFFDSIQYTVYLRQVAAGQTPTGLWEDGITYTSMSGLKKITDMYESRHEIKYREYIVDAAIQANLIPADDPEMKASQVIYVFNPWSGLGNVIDNAKKYGTEAEVKSLYEKARAAAVDMINITKAKLVPFMHMDGSFSYNDTGLSSATTQGVEVSLGLNEGDVNATVLGINGVIANVFTALGYDRVPLWDSVDAEAFVDIITSLSPIEKKERPSLPPVDFEDNNMTNVNTANLTASGSTAELVEDPARKDNTVLLFNSLSYTSLKNLEMTPRGEQTNPLMVVETEIYLGKDTSGMFKIMIDGLYLVEFLDKGDDGYTIRQNVTTGSEAEAAAHQILATNELGETLYIKRETWFKIRIECLITDGSPLFKVFVDTDLTDDKSPETPVITGTSYFGIHKGQAINTRFKYIKFLTNSKTVGSYYYDNVLITTYRAG